MQNVFGIIGSTIVLIFFLAIIVLMFEFVTPIVAKADFDRTCATYMKESVRSGGLTVTQTNALITELEKNPNLKVDTTDISRTGTVGYQDDVIFQVNATYTSGAMTSLLVRGITTRAFVYDKKFANDILIN